MNELPFTLQEGEKIQADIRPNKLDYILSTLGGSIIIMALFLVLALWLLTLPSRSAPYLYSALLILFIILKLVIPFISYNKFKYWVTNFRVVGSRGIIGYSIESIPLENITDVVLNRSIVERILNLSSLLVVPIGGAMIAYGRRGNNNYFPALKPQQAMDLQSLIFKLRDQRKKELGRHAF